MLAHRVARGDGSPYRDVAYSFGSLAGSLATIFLQFIAFSVIGDEQALRKHFAEYGVTDVQIPRRKTDKKKGRGFAFVGLKDADSARRAAKTQRPRPSQVPKKPRIPDRSFPQDPSPPPSYRSDRLQL